MSAVIPSLRDLFDPVTRATLAALTCASLLAACAGAGAPPPVPPPPTDRVPARSPDGGGPRLGALEAGDASAGPTLGAADPAGGATRYAVRPGDSLVAIARRLTGNADDWRVLARANAIVDPAALVPGTELVVPAALRGAGDVIGGATGGTRDGAGAEAAGGPSRRPPGGPPRRSTCSARSSARSASTRRSCSSASGSRRRAPS